MPPSCPFPNCTETALSFSSSCWAHTDKAVYLSLLQNALRRTQKEALPLNLKKVRCENIDFSHLNIPDTNFSQVSFVNCHFVGTTISNSNMIGARFESCDFIGSDLSGAHLTKAVISGCSFSHSDLRHAYLAEAHLKDADFLGALLFGCILWNADLGGAKNLKKSNFQDPDKPNQENAARLLERDALVARESYRIVKHYLHESGLYEDASWAAYRELTMERKYFLKSKNPKFIPSLLMDGLSGYTEKPQRVIVSSLVIVLLFGLIYFLLNVPTRLNEIGRASLWESIYFSFMTFTTVGYGDLTPRPVFWYQMLACAEAFSGPFMAGLYIFTLTRRYAAG